MLGCFLKSFLVCDLTNSGQSYFIMDDCEKKFKRQKALAVHLVS